MRFILAAAAMAIAISSFGSAPAAAQGGEFMWCTAWTDNGSEKAYFYSGFFAAGAWEAERKAVAFKSKVAGEGVSVAALKATCMPPSDYTTAVATRNAAMKGAPGKVLSWEG